MILFNHEFSSQMYIQHRRCKLEWLKNSFYNPIKSKSSCSYNSKSNILNEANQYSGFISNFDENKYNNKSILEH